MSGERCKNNLANPSEIVTNGVERTAVSDKTIELA